MNEMIVTYEQNYRRKEQACQTELSATQFSQVGLGDEANYYFLKHMHPLGGRVKGKESKMTIHQLVKFYEHIIEEKRMKSAEDSKAGREPTSLREIALIHFYKRNELNTSMLGRIGMDQLLTTIRYLLRKQHPFGELLSKLLWVDTERPLAQCYIQLFTDLTHKYQFYFTKGKGKGGLDRGGDEFGIVRLFDFLGFLKHEFKNPNEQIFANRVLDYVTASNFKRDFTVNNQSKYVVSDQEIKERLTSSNQMHRYDSVLVHQLNFALFSLAIQLEDFQFSLEERLHSFEFKSYSLNFQEFLTRITDLPAFIPQSHKEIFTIFLSSYEGMQDVVELQFPPRKCDSPSSVHSHNRKFETPVSTFTISPPAKKKRKYSDVQTLGRQNSMQKTIKEEIADPLEIRIMEIAGEEQSVISESDHQPLFIDIQKFIEVLKREEVPLSSHSVQISNLGISVGFVRAIEECDQKMTHNVEDYLNKVNRVKDIKNDFTYFRNALKHFIPYIDLAKLSRIFASWSTHCDCSDIDQLSRIFLETIKNEDMKAGHTLLLSQDKLSRPATPRKMSPGNLDFRKRTSYLAPSAAGLFKGSEMARRISDLK